MKRIAGLVPFRQGQLDGLCGIYAIINAIRLSLGPERASRFHRSAWHELFYVLMCTVDDLPRAGLATVTGLVGREFRTILKVAVQHMADEHEVLVRITPLLKRGERPGISQFAARVVSRLRQRNSCLMISIGGHHDHWTVVQSASRRRLTLFDSTGLRYLRIDRCRMAYEPSESNRIRHVLRSEEVLVVRSQ